MNTYFKQYEQEKSYKTAFIKIFQVIFGYDFGFFKYKTSKIKFAAKLLCLIQCFLISWSCLYELYFVQTYSPLARLWVTASTCHYVVNVIIFAFKRSDESLYQFYCDMQLVDIQLRTERKVDNKLMLSVSFCYIYRIIFNAIYCCITGCIKPAIFSFIHFLVLLTLDTVLIFYTNIYYAFYCRMQIFRKDLIANNNQLLLSYQHVYRLIADLVEKYKSAFDSVYLAAVTFSFPIMMLSIYHALWRIRNYNDPVWQLISTPENAFAVLVLGLTVGPALCASRLAAEVEKVKLVLHEKLLLEREDSKCREIERFIRYVEARPLKLSVYRLFPLNANLLGIILSVCVTYLIVLIQLTHLY